MEVKQIPWSHAIHTSTASAPIDNMGYAAFAFIRTRPPTAHRDGTQTVEPSHLVHKTWCGNAPFDEPYRQTG